MFEDSPPALFMNVRPVQQAVIHTVMGEQVLERVEPKPELQAEIFDSPLERALLTGAGDVLQWVLGAVRSTGGFSHALVGELCGADWNQIDTLVVDTLNGPAANFRYELKGTPCQEVLNSSCVAFTTNVWQLFPEDLLLEQMGIESYIGVPVYDDAGRPLGIVVLLHQEEISLETSRRGIELLSTILPLVRSTLAANRRQRDVEAILESAAASGSTTVTSLLGSLARSLMLRGAFLSPLGGEGSAHDTVLYLEGQVVAVPGFSLKAETLDRSRGGGPAFLARLFEGKAFCFSDQAVAARFSDFASLLENALLIPLRNEEGELLGIAGALHDRELNPRALELPLLQLLSEKLAMVLREQEAEQARRSAELRVRHLEQIESLGVLAAGIAHDFNNLLVGALGNADYLLEVLLNTEDSAVRECVEDIKDAAVSAHGLCKQLMAYAGRSKVDFENFDLVRSLEEVARLAVGTLGVPCTFSLEPEVGTVSVSGDETQIYQVVMNLLTNARDAVGAAGRVAVSLSTASVGPDGQAVFSGTLPADDYAVISVEDNGIGIAKDQLKRIFEPFYTTKGVGHGLGLAGVLGLIASHGGGLDVSSVPGEGTTFRVYLPLAEGAATSAVDRPSLTERPLAAQKGVLLIVDDDVRVRRLLSRFSTRAGYEVLSAENGLEAVEIYKQHEERISGVVLDLNMPVCDGEECYARLRALDPAVKVIVSSGNLVTKTTLPQLPKPYSLQTFVSAVNELLR